MGNVGKTGLNGGGQMGGGTTRTQGIPLSDMYSHVRDIPQITRRTNPDAMKVITLVKQQPNAMITIYKATAANAIKHGDYVFLDKEHADRWTRGAMGGTKPGFRVVEKQVTAGEVDWTKRGFEFLYR